MPQKQQQTIFPPPEMMPRNLQSPTSLNTCSQKLTTKISSSSASSSSTHSSSSSSSACAACKYQRKKCSSDCLLAPYFPPTKQTEFLNTHKLFGVSNITKVLRSLDNPRQREEAMRSMIFQADCRAKHPVGGCVDYIRDLQLRLLRYQAELDSVLNQIDMYRAAAQAQTSLDVNVNVVPPGNNHEDQDGIINSLDAYSHLNPQHFLQQYHDMQQQQQQQRQHYNVIIPENQVVIQNDYGDISALNQLNQMWSMESVANQNDGLIDVIEIKHGPSSISSSSPVMDDLNQQQQSSIEDPDVQ